MVQRTLKEIHYNYNIIRQSMVPKTFYSSPLSNPPTIKALKVHMPMSKKLIYKTPNLEAPTKHAVNSKQIQKRLILKLKSPAEHVQSIKAPPSKLYVDNNTRKTRALKACLYCRQPKGSSEREHSKNLWLRVCWCATDKRWKFHSVKVVQSVQGFVSMIKGQFVRQIVE